MEEFGTQYEAEVLQNKKKLDKCDLLCFVFDSSDVNSFAYVANLRVSGVPGSTFMHGLLNTYFCVTIFSFFLFGFFFSVVVVVVVVVYGVGMWGMVGRSLCIACT